MSDINKLLKLKIKFWAENYNSQNKLKAVCLKKVK